jgi:hypothetical protein
MKAEVILDLISCYKCGVVWGMGRELNNERHRDKGTFYCPNGHAQHYTKSTEETLRAEIERQKKFKEYAWAAQKAAQEQAEHERRSKNAYKGHLTKIKKRIANGVCPCCNRHFENVMRHMKGQHPDYVKQHDLG